LWFTRGLRELSFPNGVTITGNGHGQQGSGSIPISDGYQDWTFSGVKGDVVTVRMLQDNNVTLSCYVQLLDATSGQQLSASGYYSGVKDVRIQNYTLPATGAFIIRAGGAYSTTGAYTLSLTKQ